MEYIKSAFAFLGVLFLIVVFTALWMKAANYVGEHLGFADIFFRLIGRDKKKVD
jgi:hypothetical protein